MQLARPDLTPGSIASVSIEEVLKPGYCRRVRPNRWTSARMKSRVMKLYGIPRRKLLSYTGDHLVPIECGGDPGSLTDLTNYWPQPKAEAKVKDVDENRVRALLVADTWTVYEVLDYFRRTYRA